MSLIFYTKCTKGELSSKTQKNRQILMVEKKFKYSELFTGYLKSIDHYS